MPSFLERPVVTQVLWGLVAVLLLAGLVAIPTTGDDDTQRVAANGETTPGASTADDVEAVPTTAPPVPDVGGAAEATPSDTTAPAASGGTGQGAALSGSSAPSSSASPSTVAGAPATTLAPLPPPEDLGAAEDPGPTTPPRPGTYRYRFRGSGEERETTTSVESKGTNDLGTNQVITQKGGGFDSTSDVSWRKDSVILLKSVFTFGQSRGECDWEPDFVQAKLPLAKGLTWQSKSSCTVTGFGAPIVVTRTLDARVGDLRRVRIVGRSVDVWTIEGTDRIELAGRVIEQAGTSLFSPKHGLNVSSSGKATVSGPDGNQSSDYSTELLNLDPEG